LAKHKLAWKEQCMGKAKESAIRAGMIGLAIATVGHFTLHFTSPWYKTAFGVSTKTFIVTSIGVATFAAVFEQSEIKCAKGYVAPNSLKKKEGDF